VKLGGALSARLLPSADAVEVASSGNASLRAGRAGDELRLLAAARLCGLAKAALQIGVDYAKIRHAWGRPIGSFQSLAHRFADTVTATVGGRELTMYAGASIEHESDRAPTLASMAFLFAGETAVRASSLALHVHGGYGFTLEYDIQLYYRRARAYPLVWGSVQQEYQRLADQLYGPVDAQVPA
jgi:alkylation response protein AidB-like acyl-CoA dehydrogenase